MKTFGTYLVFILGTLLTATCVKDWDRWLNSFIFIELEPRDWYDQWDWDRATYDSVRLIDARA